jgi:hypothetical protein
MLVRYQAALHPELGCESNKIKINTKTLDIGYLAIVYLQPEF